MGGGSQALGTRPFLRLCRDRPYGVRRGQMCQLVRRALLGQLGMHCESEGEVLARVALGKGDVCRLAALGEYWVIQRVVFV